MEFGGRILFMDNNEAVISVAAKIFSMLGFEVQFASDGEEAVEMYEEALKSDRSFDYAFLDLIVEGGLGALEIIETLLGIDPDIKAVVVSGYPDEPVMMAYKVYGFIGSMAKPFVLDDVRRLMNRLISETGEANRKK